MANFILLLPLILSFLATVLILPHWIKRASRAGLSGRDMNKYKKVTVAESGGIPLLAGFILGIMAYISIVTFVFNDQNNNIVEILAITSSILIVTFIGTMDDILGWKIGLSKKLRILLVLFAAIPLMAINAGRSITSIPFLGQIDIGLLYPLIFIPIGIVGATTTYNFLAGFNGLEAGQGIILLSALSIAALFTGNSWLAVVGFVMVFSLIALLAYNFYPAKVLPGDSATYAIGALVACMAILGNFEKVAVFFFIPYIIETVLKGRGKLRKESFGLPKKDGSLDLRYPKIYGLEHLAIYLFKKLNIKPTEKRVVYLIWLFQIVIILLGFLIFREGLFY